MQSTIGRLLGIPFTLQPSLRTVSRARRVISATGERDSGSVEEAEGGSSVNVLNMRGTYPDRRYSALFVRAQGRSRSRPGLRDVPVQVGPYPAEAHRAACDCL